MASVRRALISVSDKSGIADCARRLHALHIEILSTGGTAKLLAEQGIPVIEVSAYTGFPELMDGRLKTLHPKIHGGLLGRRGVDDAVMQAHGIAPIDLLIVNLYPFEKVTGDPGCDRAQAIENIDIGGPALLRAAAKNHAAVTVLVDQADYDPVLDELSTHGEVQATRRLVLAAKAFQHCARYDAAIAHYLSGQTPAASLFPPALDLHFHKVQDMRYGENPHQRGALYKHPTQMGIATATQLQGKALSYNNVMDADAALACVASFSGLAACVIVKHANPCGVAVGKHLLDAYERAYRTDPTSAFGGIIAFNDELDEQTAEIILARQFVEVIIAPAVSAAATAVLATKPNVRVLATGASASVNDAYLDCRCIRGGLLVQEHDSGHVQAQELNCVTRRRPTAKELDDLLFAWRVAKFVKSNAIVYARDGATLGIGAGQMSRVYSARIALLKAADEGLEISGSVMASDAFFPFRDGVDSAAAAGVKAVIQPGGSMRDGEVIAAADEHGMAMVFTGMRHFRH